jgi:hypothetical protein
MKEAMKGKGKGKCDQPKGKAKAARCNAEKNNSVMISSPSMLHRYRLRVIKLQRTKETLMIGKR